MAVVFVVPNGFWRKAPFLGDVSDVPVGFLFRSRRFERAKCKITRVILCKRCSDPTQALRVCPHEHARQRHGSGSQGRREHQPGTLRAPHNSLGNRMLRLPLDRSHKAQYARFIEAIRNLEIGQLGALLGQRTSLVECDHLHITEGLQRIALTEQNAQFCHTASADHDRRGSSQPHGAEARNNEHCRRQGKAESGISAIRVSCPVPLHGESARLCH